MSEIEAIADGTTFIDRDCLIDSTYFIYGLEENLMKYYKFYHPHSNNLKPELREIWNNET